MAFLFGAYNLGRYLSMGHAGEAFAHAHRLIQLQSQLGLPSEASVQRAALHVPDLAQTANRYYEFVHFPLTALVLLWLMIRRAAQYPKARWALASLTGLALIGHLVFPLAPPRMMPGWIDTGALLGQSVYGPDAQSGLANQFAAMPSLHVGWALMVAVFMIRATRSRWRWLWIAHPVLTFTVVVVTANHYWSDGLIAITLAVPLLIVFRPKQFKPNGRVRRDSAPALLGATDQSAGVVAVASSSSARTR
ncbi:phosphatase PAP2 family protein [Kribbella monticola]|uniref:phosphatase PAP2 family protein n=1 Tax=Kribbella monticola TaxID=2185285 RepID=UPI001E284071|nr:phosphatase PAP2 family protein [Kribbella monticola]